MPSRDLLVPDALLPISKSGDIDMQQLGELRLTEASSRLSS